MAWAIGILSLATIISVATAFYLYRWRKIMFQKGDGSEEAKFVMPEEWYEQIKTASDNVKKLNDALDQKAQDLENTIGKRLEHTDATATNTMNELLKGYVILRNLEEKLKDTDGIVRNKTSDILQKINELFDGYMTLQKSLNEKEAEIKRLKDGYDVKIFRQFLYRFVRISKTVDEVVKDNKAPKIMSDIQNLFEDALDECEVEKFSPEINADYRKAFGVADHPEIEPTDDADKDYLIAEVLTEGYRMVSKDNKGDIIVGAKVKIFKHQKQQENEA